MAHNIRMTMITNYFEETQSPNSLNDAMQPIIFLSRKEGFVQTSILSQNECTKNPVAIQWLGLDPYEDLVVKMMA